MMMDSEEEEEQTALVCDNGKFNRDKYTYIEINKIHKSSNRFWVVTLGTVLLLTIKTCRVMGFPKPLLSLLFCYSKRVSKFSLII